MPGVQESEDPLFARALFAFLIAYALSPLDLITHLIPILGQLDDVILIPLGTALAMRMIPQEVLMESRRRAGADAVDCRSWRWVGVCVVVSLWALMATLTVVVIVRTLA